MTRISGALAVSLVLASSSAQATVDVFLPYYVPYYEPQSGDVCLMRQTMLASLGIPQASTMRATAAKAQTYTEEPSVHFSNINLAGTTPAMVPTYVSDGVATDGTWEFAMKLNVTALATAMGTTVTGRRATVFAAKLYLLAMAQNMAKLSNGKYRLKVTFTGLPSQTGLPGTTLYATTSSPYSAVSPLLAAYRKELINVTASCPPLL